MSFLKERASLEESYGKALRKLSQKIPDLPHLPLQGGSSMAQALQSLKSETDRQGALHMELASAVEHKVAAALEGVRASESKDQKVVIGEGQNLVKNLEAAQAAVAKARKKVMEANTKLEQAQFGLQQMGGELDNKETAKATSKATVALKEREAADSAFARSSEVLQQERIAFTRSMAVVLAALQRGEEIKLAALGRSIDAYARTLKDSLAAHLSTAEALAGVSGSVDVRKDLERLVGVYATTQAPQDPVYEQFRTTFESHTAPVVQQQRHLSDLARSSSALESSSPALRGTASGGSNGASADPQQAQPLRAVNKPLSLVTGGAGLGRASTGSITTHVPPPSPGPAGLARGSVSEAHIVAMRPELASLNSILAHPGASAAFRRFLDSRYCSESLAFYQAVESLPNSFSAESPDTMLKAINEVFAEYIAVNSPQEVNLESAVRTRISTKLATDEFVRNPSASIFDEAKDIVFRLMQDNSYSAFIKSKFAEF